MLRPDPSFLPKINSAFHRSQEVILPSFCTEPVHAKERSRYTLDVCRALRFYSDRTKDFCKMESLFIKFGSAHMGEKASPPPCHTFSSWCRSKTRHSRPALICMWLCYIPRGKRMPSSSSREKLNSYLWRSCSWKWELGILPCTFRPGVCFS